MNNVVKMQTKMVVARTLTVVLQRDLVIGDIQTLKPDADLKNKKTLKKGRQVTIRFDVVPDRKFFGIGYGGLVVKVIGGTGKNGYAFIPGRKQAVETLLRGHFKPIIKSWDVCSIIPLVMRNELLKFGIEVYKTRSYSARYIAEKVIPMFSKIQFTKAA